MAVKKKQKFPPAVRACLWSYDKDKMSLSNPGDRRLIIFNTLNYGTEEAARWTQEHFPEKEIKAVIRKSYASAWNWWSLKQWAAFYKVKPKWKDRGEYLFRHDKEMLEKHRATGNLWPNGGDTIYDTLTF